MKVLCSPECVYGCDPSWSGWSGEYSNENTVMAKALQLSTTNNSSGLSVLDKYHNCHATRRRKYTSSRISNLDM